MKIAEVGNLIEFKNGLQGIVEKVNENSVIVDLTYMTNYRDQTQNSELLSTTKTTSSLIQLCKGKKQPESKSGCFFIGFEKIDSFVLL